MRVAQFLSKKTGLVDAGSMLWDGRFRYARRGRSDRISTAWIPIQGGGQRPYRLILRTRSNLDDDENGELERYTVEEPAWVTSHCSWILLEKLVESDFWVSVPWLQALKGLTGNHRESQVPGEKAD